MWFHEQYNLVDKGAWRTQGKQRELWLLFFFASLKEHILLDGLVTLANIYNLLWSETIHNVINSNNDKLNSKWIEKHKVISNSS